MFQKQTRLHKRISDLVKSEALEFTAPEVKRNISSLGVNLNGNIEHRHLTWTYDFDKISIDHWPRRPKGDFDLIQTWYENDDTIVIFKPRNVVVEPGAGHREDNLMTFLTEKYKRQFYLAHRIDKDTSGLLVLTKTPEQLEFIQNQFRTHKVTKKYLAVVKGLVTMTYHVTSWQGRDSGNPLRQKLYWSEKGALDLDPQARQAVSIIKPLIICPNSNLSLVEITIKTGRMHQIRLQCEALGFPLNGDAIYNRNTGFKKQLELPSKSFFGIEQLKSMNSEEFIHLQIKVFGHDGYSLLANFIKFELNPGRFWEGEVFDLGLLN